jgi:hypothetical protein
MPDADKIQAIAGFNLDDMLALSSVPWADADLHERHAKVNIFLAFLKAGYQVSRDRAREAELAQVLDAVDGALRAHARPLAPKDTGRSDTGRSDTGRSERLPPTSDD